MMWGMGWSMWLIPLIIILVVYFLVKEGTGKSEQGETPLDILKKRYAKGEITKEAFERMKEDLQ